MQPKKVILILAFLLFFLSVFHLYPSFPFPPSLITGEASNTATVSLCFNNPPQITSIPDQTATVGQSFTYQVEANDSNANANLTYSDNTLLFSINQSGYISFTPQSSDLGTHSIEITVDDSSGCSNSNATETFSLTISSAPSEEEEPTPGPGPGGGGGGFPTTPIKLSFQLSQELLKVALRQSQKLEKKLTITNNGTVDLEIKTENPLSRLVYLTPPSFKLPVGETKDIFLVFNPQKDAPLGVHSGQVIVKGTYKSYLTKTLTLILEIESEEIVFDASLDLLKKSLLPVEELKATLTIFNLKKIIPTANITLTYLISDLNQNILYQEKEFLTVEEQVSFSKTFSLPEKLPPGQYLLSLHVQHLDSFATASELFTVEEPPSALVGLAAPLAQKPGFILSIPILFFVIILLVLITISLLLFFHFHKKKPAPNLEKLSTWVAEARQKGATDQQLRQLALRSGWSEEDLNKVL